MTTIHVNRRILGRFLLVAAPLVMVIVWADIATGGPWWTLLFIVPLVTGVAYLAHMYFTNPPVITIGEGHMVLPRFLRAPIRIPLHHIDSAHIMEPWADGGRAYFLQVTLTTLAPELEFLKDTFLKRQTLGACRQVGGYQPPPEPFIILQTPVLNVSDQELCAIIETERESGRELGVAQPLP
jgi:hypothetical protein